MDTLVKKYFPVNTSEEIHMIGSNVGVCWHTKEIAQVKEDENGSRVKVTTCQKKGDPYISFPWLVKDGEGNCYRKDCLTIEGGIHLIQAEEVIKELQWACGYIRELQ